MPHADRPWSLRRFRVICDYYLNELRLIQSSETMKIGESQIRLRLGDLIGRSIRFYLRRFFNPVPVSLHSLSSNEQPDYDFCRSSVHTMIEMIDDNGQRDTAVADGSIASVFSLALIHMYDFFELGKKFSMISSDSTQFINSFCQRPASIQGLQKKGSIIMLKERDLDEVLLDIADCHATLAGIRASKFFHSLIMWPGVGKAINNVGGWHKVEEYADMFHRHRLGIENPCEMQFHLLKDVPSLVQKIDRSFEELTQIENACENSLRGLWKRFRCGTKSKDLLRLNPGIKIIQRHLKAGGHTNFPSIQEFTEEE